MQYFSERESGELSRDNKDIGEDAWGGIRALIRARVEDGSFGYDYPQTCEDGPIRIGTDAAAFRDAMRAHIPGLEAWPWGNTTEAPSTLQILDIIEFCCKYVAKPSSTIPHRNHFFHHDHLLEFDEEAGREEFRAEIETIFRRNGIAYELTKQGLIERLLYPVLREALAESDFDTGDTELDDLLGKARRKFLDRDPELRREALQPLWDAWERLKSIEGEGDVRAGVRSMLDTVAGPDSPKLREVMEREANELRDIGNRHGIRHRDTNQENITKSEHVDYLFHRMFSLIQLVLRLR